MRRLWILVGLLAAAAAFAFFAARNFNRFLQSNRAWLAERASAALGRTVEFEAIGVSFRGGLGARLTGLSIGDDPAFSAEPCLRVAEAEVVVKILPALVGRYEVRRVVLDAPRINVIREARGLNFASLGGTTPAPAGAGGAPRGGAAAAENPVPLLVSLVSIENGHVRFIDRTTSPASEAHVDDLDVAVSDLGFARPISVDMSAALFGAAKPNLNVAGSIGPLGDASALSRAPVDLEAKVGPLVIDQLKQAPLVGPLLPPALSSPDPIAATVEVAGTLDELRVSLAMDASAAAIAYGDQLNKAKGMPLRVEADLVRRDDAIEVTRLDLRVAAARLHGQGRIGTGAGAPIDLRLDGRDMPLDGWADLLPAAAAVQASGSVDLQIAAVGSVAGGRVPAISGTIAVAHGSFARPDGSLRVDGFETTIALKGDRVEIPTTRFQVNGSPVELTATVKSLRDLATEFSVKSPVVELAALGASDEHVEKPELVKDVEVRGEFRAAADGPRLDVDVRSREGSVRDVGYENLAGEATLRGAVVTLRRLSVSTFGGSVVGAGSYDMSERQTPQFAFRGKVGGLDVAALVERFAPSGAVQMSGRLDADLDVRGSGAQWNVIREAVTGGGAVEVKEGTLKGVNIADEVFRGVTGVQGLSGLTPPALRKKYPRIFADTDTRFDAIESQVTLGGGSADVERLLFSAPDYRLDGNGKIDLENSLDLRLTFAASPQLTADLLGGVKQLKYVTDDAGRLRIPVSLRGSLPSIRVQPDLRYLSDQLTGALLESGIEEGLNAVFGKKSKKKEAPTGGVGDAAGGREEAPAEKLIRKGLEGLFGGTKKRE